MLVRNYNDIDLDTSTWSNAEKEMYEAMTGGDAKFCFGGKIRCETIPAKQNHNYSREYCSLESKQDLPHAYFYGDYSESTFNALPLDNTHWLDCNLTSAIFYKANLSSARFDNVTLANADFNGAGMDSVDFGNTDLTGVKFQNTDLRNADLRDVKNIYSANFNNANLTNAKFADDVDFSHSCFAGAKFNQRYAW